MVTSAPIVTSYPMMTATEPLAGMPMTTASVIAAAPVTTTTTAIPVAAAPSYSTPGGSFTQFDM